MGTACGIAGDAAAHAGEPPMLVRAFDGLRDETEQPGIQGINLRGELRMAAIHREGVLGEIVGADRKEICLLGEDLRHHGDGGNFHHDAARASGRFRAKSLPRSRIAFASRSSFIVAIIGNMIVAASRTAEARSSARSCVRRISGRSSPTRMPRSPRKGLSSLGIGK